MAAGRNTLQQQLDGIGHALEHRGDAASRAALVKGLRSGNGHVVGKIADALTEDDGALLELLADAFARLLEDPVKRDPACRGKVAIAKTLDRVERRAAEVFERGVRWVQHEPVWGGKVDTAAELRGVCGMAMVHMRHPRAIAEVARLLADPETAARVAAARAVAVSGDRHAGEPLLRLRLTIGDPDAEVLGECFGALLELAGDDAIDDVGAALSSSDDVVAQAAAIALGGSRLGRAFALLRDANESQTGGVRRRSRLLAIALVRSPDAWTYLLALVADGSRAAAEDAARALLTFAHDDELMQRLRDTATSRGDAALVDLVDDALPG